MKFDRDKAELVTVLKSLRDAADVYAADQSRAKDPRCGLVQPISVEDGENLNASLMLADSVLDKYGEGSEKTGIRRYANPISPIKNAMVRILQWGPVVCSCEMVEQDPYSYKWDHDAWNPEKDDYGDRVPDPTYEGRYGALATRFLVPPQSEPTS